MTDAVTKAMMLSLEIRQAEKQVISDEQRTKTVIISHLDLPFVQSSFDHADKVIKRIKRAMKTKDGLDLTAPLEAEDEQFRDLMGYFITSQAPKERQQAAIKRNLGKVAPELPCAAILEVPSIGGPSVARFIGEMGGLDRFNSVGEVLFYAGLAPRAAVGRQGNPDNWKRSARAVLHTASQAVVKNRSGAHHCPYVDVYDIEKDRMTAKAEKIINHKGNLVWSPCAPNQHADKMVAREICRDIFRAYKGQELSLGSTRLPQVEETLEAA